jgi:hypothetical protein
MDGRTDKDQHFRPQFGPYHLRRFKEYLVILARVCPSIK